MKSKKAWIRIAEAAIAIIMLASIILMLIGKQAEKNDLGESMYKIQHSILDEAARNETVRSAALSGNDAVVKSFITERMPPGINFTVKICGLAGQCSIELPEKEVYVDDILVSSTMIHYEPRKLRFFAWIE
ncbi:MAG: hypothetical protein V1886_00715 [archaeon]